MARWHCRDKADFSAIQCKESTVAERTIALVFQRRPSKFLYLGIA